MTMEYRITQPSTLRVHISEPMKVYYENITRDAVTVLKHSLKHSLLDISALRLKILKSAAFCLRVLCETEFLQVSYFIKR